MESIRLNNNKTCNVFFGIGSVLSKIIIGVIGFALISTVALSKANAGEKPEVDEIISAFQTINWDDYNYKASINPFSSSKYCEANPNFDSSKESSIDNPKVVFISNADLDPEYDNCLAMQSYYDQSMEILTDGEFGSQGQNYEDLNDAANNMNKSYKPAGIITSADSPFKDIYGFRQDHPKYTTGEATKKALDGAWAQIGVTESQVVAYYSYAKYYKVANDQMFERYNIVNQINGAERQWGNESWYIQCKMNKESAGEKAQTALTECEQMWADAAKNSNHKSDFDNNGAEKDASLINKAAIEMAQTAYNLQNNLYSVIEQTLQTISRAQAQQKAFPIHEEMAAQNFNITTLSEDDLQILEDSGVDVSGYREIIDKAHAGVYEYNEDFSVASDSNGKRLAYSDAGDCYDSQSGKLNDNTLFSQCLGTEEDEKFQRPSITFSTDFSNPDGYSGDTNFWSVKSEDATDYSNETVNQLPSQRLSIQNYAGMSVSNRITGSGKLPDYISHLTFDEHLPQSMKDSEVQDTTQYSKAGNIMCDVDPGGTTEFTIKSHINASGEYTSQEANNHETYDQREYDLCQIDGLNINLTGALGEVYEPEIILNDTQAATGGQIDVRGNDKWAYSKDKGKIQDIEIKFVVRQDKLNLGYMTRNSDTDHTWVENKTSPANDAITLGNKDSDIIGNIMAKNGIQYYGTFNNTNLTRKDKIRVDPTNNWTGSPTINDRAVDAVYISSMKHETGSHTGAVLGTSGKSWDICQSYVEMEENAGVIETNNFYDKDGNVISNKTGYTVSSTSELGYYGPYEEKEASNYDTQHCSYGWGGNEVKQYVTPSSDDDNKWPVLGNID
ncbi:MAG: hypothetical protein LBM13_03760, partial [Candidatus Ancillula sp.]|nr:hypothetical protein [Candidatus Ancillula sp.]